MSFSGCVLNLPFEFGWDSRKETDTAKDTNGGRTETAYKENKRRIWVWGRMEFLKMGKRPKENEMGIEYIFKE